MQFVSHCMTPENVGEYTFHSMLSEATAAAAMQVHGCQSIPHSQNFKYKIKLVLCILPLFIRFFLSLLQFIFFVAQLLRTN